MNVLLGYRGPDMTSCGQCAETLSRTLIRGHTVSAMSLSVINYRAYGAGGEITQPVNFEINLSYQFVLNCFKRLSLKWRD